MNPTGTEINYPITLPYGLARNIMEWLVDILNRGDLADYTRDTLSRRVLDLERLGVDKCHPGKWDREFYQRWYKKHNYDKQDLWGTWGVVRYNPARLTKGKT
jgi:hypothetical protein